MYLRFKSGNWRFAALCAFLFMVLAFLCVHISVPAVSAQSNGTRFPAYGYLISNPTVTIAAGSATTTAQPTSGASLAHVEFDFGTVSGSYATCSVQAKTSYDGTNFLSLGSAASVTVSSNAINAWDIMAQVSNASTPAVTVTAPSSTVAVGFGMLTEYVFSCSTYGASAPVSVTAIYK